MSNTFSLWLLVRFCESLPLPHLFSMLYNPMTYTLYPSLDPDLQTEMSSFEPESFVILSHPEDTSTNAEKEDKSECCRLPYKLQKD